MRYRSGEIFASQTRLSVYIDHLAKIDTQLQIEVIVEDTKVEEIFKVNSLKHE